METLTAAWSDMTPGAILGLIFFVLAFMVFNWLDVDLVRGRLDAGKSRGAKAAQWAFAFVVWLAVGIVSELYVRVFQFSEPDERWLDGALFAAFGIWAIRRLSPTPNDRGS